MRYKTVIEVVCEAPNRDEAVNSAGEYLSGKSLHDVVIRFTAKSLRSHLITKAWLGLMVVLLLYMFLCY